MVKPNQATAKRSRSRLLVTIPDEILRWLREHARYNGGSVSGEVVRAVRAEMARIKSSPQTQP
jgi:hypothetical protein